MSVLSDHGPTEGPYERWVFSETHGRPYAFPSIAAGGTGIYSALMEEGGNPVDLNYANLRIPPLWNPGSVQPEITPFAFRDAVTPATPGAGLRYRLNFPVPVDTWTGDYQKADDPAGWAPPAVQPSAIVAVIDDAIPFANRAFLGSDGKTRISHCWLQAGIAVDRAPVPLGREYTNGAIDQLRQDTPSDENRLYQQAGAVDPDMVELGGHLKRHGTHGSHILGLAAGNTSLFTGDSQGDDIQIIAVQMPNTIAWDTSGFGKEMYMLSALHYVFERARRIADHFGVDELPLIVNLSYGWGAGRHDGQSPMEIAIEDLLEKRQAVQPKTAIVMPMGNGFTDKMHARISETDFGGKKYNIGWQVQPDDNTSSYLELWFPEGFDPAKYRLTLKPPPGYSLDQKAVLKIRGSDSVQFRDVHMGGEVVGQMSADHSRGNRWRFMLALIPSTYCADQSRSAPAGRWTVKLRRKGNAPDIPKGDDLLIWVQRDDDPAMLQSRGRQSYLVKPRKQGSEITQPPYQKYKDEIPGISGFGSMNAVASSSRTTRVSGYVQHNKRPADYAGSGRLHVQEKQDPAPVGAQTLIVACSDQSPSSPGIPSTGVLSGSRTRLVGTSAAAPAVARLMVLNAAAGRDLTDGLNSTAALYRSEKDNGNTQAQHKARMGDFTASPVTR